MLSTRILPPSEWSRLTGTELETLYPILPEGAQVVVVEEDGPSPRIVGTWAIYKLVHVEGVWISPEHRGKAGVARRLIGKTFEVAKALGARAVNTAAVTPEVAEMLKALGGVELQGRHFAVSLNGQGGT